MQREQYRPQPATMLNYPGLTASAARLWYVLSMYSRLWKMKIPLSSHQCAACKVKLSGSRQLWSSGLLTIWSIMQSESKTNCQTFIPHLCSFLPQGVTAKEFHNLVQCSENYKDRITTWWILMIRLDVWTQYQSVSYKQIMIKNQSNNNCSILSTVHTLFWGQVCAIAPWRHKAALTWTRVHTECTVGICRQTSEAFHDVSSNVQPLHRLNQPRLNTCHMSHKLQLHINHKHFK